MDITKKITFILSLLFPLLLQADINLYTTANRTADADTTTAVCASSIKVTTLSITCLNTNTEGCVVGDTNVDHGTLVGIYLSAGGTVTIDGDLMNDFKSTIDCSTVYFEVGVNSEGISVSYLR